MLSQQNKPVAFHTKNIEAQYPIKELQYPFILLHKQGTIWNLFCLVYESKISPSYE